MSSIFVAFCFIESVTRKEKDITGSALYREDAEKDNFKEIFYRGYIGNPDNLILEFGKNSVVLMVGRHVLEGAEYLTLTQSVPILISSSENKLTRESLPRASPLLLFSAPVITNSYQSDEKGLRDSFMLFRKSYNGVNNCKNIDSNVIVSFKPSSRYSLMKNHLKKTIISTLGRFRIVKNNMVHILASEIEWNYPGNEFQSGTSEGSIESQLEAVESRYGMIEPTPSKRQQNTESSGFNNFGNRHEAIEEKHVEKDLVLPRRQQRVEGSNFYFDDQLEVVEERYAERHTSPSRKRQRTNLS
ncbi:9227_t:CDS:2 [Acaulospora morrowiae]|uniref:9227_t:CDS:1 n=1 Tax=Acaulospora morrowiae TaxID=94023 RepID=A0A9N8WLB5_9GLOM|nr:9227_t:CDS:2 [Acaulospora morrowiae]